MKTKLTPEQKKALDAYQRAEREEDRFCGSVFANAFSVRKQQEKTTAAYLECKRLGMGTEHGL